MISDDETEPRTEDITYVMMENCSQRGAVRNLASCHLNAIYFLSLSWLTLWDTGTAGVPAE